MEAKKRTTLIISCPQCKTKMDLLIWGEVKDGYKIPCQEDGCEDFTFIYKPKMKNFQCHYCNDISAYMYDEREEFKCVNCDKPMTGYLTQNSGSILKEIVNTLKSFPEKYLEIKNHGFLFMESVLSQTNNLNDDRFLKSGLAEFQKSVHYLSEHLKKHGK